MDKGIISLSRAELKKALVIDKLIQQQITTVQAAVVLGLTPRQVIRLKAKVIERGSEALAHGNRGRSPAHTISDSVRQTIIQACKERYHGANDCHASDLLAEHEQIKVSPSSVGRILTAAGFAPARQRRRSKPHRPRERRPQAGMLWQTDASTHAWLEERGPSMALHGAIDDATGTVTAAVFRPTEDLIGYLSMMDKGIRKYGVPLGLYSDQHTIFFVPAKPLTIDQELAGETEALSQFGKALSELHIEHIRARSAQAKGRIERLWQTFQDRLIIELRIRNICTLDKANEVLAELLERHNERFAVAPHESDSAYREIPDDMPLNHIFCRRQTRTITPAQTLSFMGNVYRVEGGGKVSIPGRMKLQIRHTLTDELVVYYEKQAYTLTKIPTVKRTEKVAPEETSERKPYKPPANHPWRRPNKKNSASSAQ